MQIHSFISEIELCSIKTLPLQANQLNEEERFLELQEIHRTYCIPVLHNIIAEYLKPNNIPTADNWREYIILDSLANKNMKDWEITKISNCFKAAFLEDDYDLGFLLLKVEEIKDIDLNISFLERVNSSPAGWNLNLLHQAVYFNKINFLRAILDSKLFDVNYKTMIFGLFTKYDVTPLHIATYNLNEVAIRLLLNVPNIDISLRDGQNYRPYDRILAQNNKILQIRCVEIFEKTLLELDRTEDLNRTRDGLTLLLACKNGFNEIAKDILISPYLENVNFQEYNYGPTPLFAAILNNSDLSVIQNLLNHPKINVNLRSFYQYSKITPIHLAVYQNNLNAIELLVFNPSLNLDLSKEQTSDLAVNRIDRTPIFTAVRLNNVQAVKLLLSQQLKFKDSYDWSYEHRLFLDSTPRYVKTHFKSCFQMARENQNDEILALLEEALIKQQNQSCNIQ